MSDQQWPPRQPGEPRPPHRGQQPHPGPWEPHPGRQQPPHPGRQPQPDPGQQRPRPGQHQPYPGGQRYPDQRPYPGQHQPYPPVPQGPYPPQQQPYGQQPYPPEQPYGQQPYPPEQAYGQQPYPPEQAYQERPYPEQPYAEQPYAEQPYAEHPYPDQHHAGQQPPAYPPGLGPGRFGPEPPKKRTWPKVLVGLLVLALVGVGGYGAYDFYEQTQKWEQTTTDDLNGVGSDLSVAVASLRSVGWEVTATDIGTWLEQPGAYGDGLRLRTLQADDAARSFSVAGYRTWQDTYAKRDHTTVVCANITLATGTQKPLSETVTTCPDDVPKTAPDTGRAEAEAESGGVTGHLVELAVKASDQRSAGAAEGKLLEVAAPTRPVGDVRADSTALACAPGTKDLGEGEGYDEGRLIPVRLCAVEGLPNTGTESTQGDPYYIDGADGLTVVNARISGAAAALVKKASKQGVDLVAGSSFRTMKKQKALCQEDATGGCPAGDYTLTARPGYSSHQLGIAIDFEQPSVTGGKTCATRASEPSSAVWRFLNKTALSVGLKQYSAEAWHWDAYGGEDRCAPM